MKKVIGFGIAKAFIGQKSKAVVALDYLFVDFSTKGLNKDYGIIFNDLENSGKNISTNANEAVLKIDEAVLKILNSHNLDAKLSSLVGLLGDYAGEFYIVAFFEDLEVKSIFTAYLKLVILSKRLALPRSLNLNGVFASLQNLAWSGTTPFELEYLRENEVELKIKNEFPTIDFVDKFPRYLMQIIPTSDNMRFLDSANTRLGAYVSEGYTQMPGASYLNFNSGTLGACMNEGRISSSVIIGKGTDVGGGASILGVLSGGNSEPISIGANCLLGANSVTGISLGDYCIVDAGISALSGMVFRVDRIDLEKILNANSGTTKIDFNKTSFKGRELSGLNALHFRQNSTTGEMIVKFNTKHIALNDALH